MTLARQLAEYAFRLTFRDLPPEVVHQTQRLLLDTLGCATGGYDSEAREAIEAYIQESGHTGEATVFGSGLRTSSLNATLANGAMVRYLDYNDTAFILQGETYRTGYHPSEVIPSILALGERQRLTGKEVIAAIVAAMTSPFLFWRQ